MRVWIREGIVLAPIAGEAVTPAEGWSRDPETGKNRPSGKQAVYQGVPVWELVVTMALDNFGSPRSETVTLRLAATERPSIADFIGREAA